jgi:lipoprotein NlpD
VPAATPDAPVAGKPLPAVPGNTYTVKAGDTLFSIAKANNVAVRDLAAWNNIDDPSNISVGQVLRLTSPNGVAVTPAKAPGAVEGKPISGAPTEASTPADNTVRGPVARRVPYSDQAYAEISKPPVPAKPEVVAEAKPTAKPDVKPEVKPEVKPDATPEAKADKPRAPGDMEWVWPTQGTVVGKFNQSSSKGIAIAGQRGQAVQASAAGRVIFSGNGPRGLGRLVVIRHNATYLSVYAHNDKLLVREGQNVAKGQRIAEMGSTDADRVKLHFEIRRQGKPVDPLTLLPDT